MDTPATSLMTTLTSKRRRHTSAVRPLYWSLGNDMLIAIAIIGVLIYCFAPDLRAPVMRAKLTQVFTLAQQVRHDQIVEHAVHGSWPNEMPDGAIQLGEGITLAQTLFANGHFNFELILPDGGGRQGLSFRRAENTALGTRFWYCGYAGPDMIAAVTIPDITEIPAAWLPSSCRTRP